MKKGNSWKEMEMVLTNEDETEIQEPNLEEITEKITNNTIPVENGIT